MRRFFRLVGALSLWEFSGRYPTMAGVLTLLGVGGGIVASARSIRPRSRHSHRRLSVRPYSPLEQRPEMPTGIIGRGHVSKRRQGLIFRVRRGLRRSGAKRVMNTRLAPAFQARSPDRPRWPRRAGIHYANEHHRRGGWWTAISPFTWGSDPGGRSGTEYLKAIFRGPRRGERARGSLGIVGPTPPEDGRSRFRPRLSISDATDAAQLHDEHQGRVEADTRRSGLHKLDPVRSGEMTVTAPLAHGIYPGQTFHSCRVYSPTGFNNTDYVAPQGTLGTTLVGEIPHGVLAFAPPRSLMSKARALSGTGGAVCSTRDLGDDSVWSQPDDRNHRQAGRPFLRSGRRIWRRNFDARFPVRGLHRSEGTRLRTRPLSRDGPTKAPPTSRAIRSRAHNRRRRPR